MKNIKHTVFFLVSIFFIVVSCKDKPSEKTNEVNTTEKKPNIIVIYLDDLGYGDISSYGATALQTPNIDALAYGGIKFTNGYASSATCTPSRYAI